MAETEGHQLFQKVLPECTEPSQDLLCFFPTQAYRGSFGPAIKPTLSYDASGHTPLKQCRQRDQRFVNSGGGRASPGARTCSPLVAATPNRRRSRGRQHRRGAPHSERLGPNGVSSTAS